MLWVFSCSRMAYGTPSFSLLASVKYPRMIWAHCTGDLNKGRRGAYVHVCYDYWTFGTLNPEVHVPTVCELRRSDGTRRLSNMLPAPGSEAPSVGFEKSQLLQRLMGNRRRVLPEQCVEGNAYNCYFGFPGFTSKGYPHVHASWTGGLFVSFQTPKELEDVFDPEIQKGNPRPKEVVIARGLKTERGWENKLARRLFGFRIEGLCPNNEEDNTYCTWENFIRQELPDNELVVTTSTTGYCESGDCANPNVRWHSYEGLNRADAPNKFGVPEGGASGAAFTEMVNEIGRILTWYQTVWGQC